ncbi:MAG: hypothetical protein methR_P2625 [Methyloprofundus sp.]|nr:MAG: hypothetical protein methR_P2625 [Methyloprofundus sp.]
MGNMAKTRLIFTKHSVLLLLGFIGSFINNGQAVAMSFIFTPRITVQETYSDNIRLAASKELKQSAFVTEVSPGISVRGIRGGRASLNLDYNLQTIFNAGGDGSTNIFHQLQFDGNYRVSRNRFNVAARSSISQRNTSNIRIGDNLNNLGTRTNVYSAGFSPVWTPHFGSFANAVVRVDFDYIANRNFTDNANITENGLLDSINVSESVQLRSGRDFQRITWNAAFNNTDNIRSNDVNSHFQNMTGTIRAWTDRRFNFFGTVSYDNNDFASLDTSTNGASYTVGAQWIPSRFFNIEAGYGNNWHVSGNLNPSRFTHIGVGYFDRSRGLNTGGAWNARIDHRTKRSFWLFTYTEDTVTNQRLLLDNTLPPVALPSFTNDVIIRKNANASVSYYSGKSTVQLGGFYQRRKFSNIDNQLEKVYGADISWNWAFIRRTRLFVAPSWSQINRSSTSTGSSKDNRYEALIRLTRTLPLAWGRTTTLNTSLEYRYLKQISNLVVNNVEVNSFTENRVTLSLSLFY